MKATFYLKHFLALIISTGLAVSSCKKAEDNKEPEDDTPTGSVTVSSYSPEFPIWEGIITIKGNDFELPKTI